MSDRDFGGTIRRRRERLGLSVSRVAELVGRAPGTIRAWERGTLVPEDPSAVSTLAAVLGLDESATFQLAGLAPPIAEGQVTVEQALRSLSDSEEPSRLLFGDRVGTRERRTPSGGVDLADSNLPPAPPPAPPAGARPRPVRAPSGEEGASSASGTGRSPSGPGFLNRLRAATVRRPGSAAPLTTLPAAPVEPSYMENPEERWSYRLRSLLTAAGIGFLLLVFGWAATNFLDAISETWDILTSNL